MTRDRSGAGCADDVRVDDPAQLELDRLRPGAGETRARLGTGMVWLEAYDATAEGAPSGGVKVGGWGRGIALAALAAHDRTCVVCVSLAPIASPL